MMPLRVGSRCWTMTKAMPLPFGTCAKKCSKASSPPAEAPMPTMRNVAASVFRPGALDLNFIARGENGVKSSWMVHAPGERERLRK